jgi:hypothetical protein
MDESDFPSREAYVAARISYIKRRLSSLGDTSQLPDHDEQDPEMALAFLEQILAIESEPCVTYAHQLIARGISLPDPATLSDEELHTKLWEVIHGLAGLRVFLENTGHLHDRDLYRQLWSDSLNEFTWDMSHCTNGAMHLDLVGTGSEEDTLIWLEYYADAQQRREWMDQFPDDPAPLKKEPVSDRDDFLPQPGRE